MPRYAQGGITTNGGSTTLPLCALVGGAANRLSIVEIGIFNTTATACAVKLARLSTAGTPGATMNGALSTNDPENTATPTGILKNSYSSTAPTSADMAYRVQLASAIGAGFVWTFGAGGLIVPAIANDGLGILVENGTGQILQVYFVWDE